MSDLLTYKQKQKMPKYLTNIFESAESEYYKHCMELEEKKFKWDVLL